MLVLMTSSCFEHENYRLCMSFFFRRKKKLQQQHHDIFHYSKEIAHRFGCSDKKTSSNISTWYRHIKSLLREIRTLFFAAFAIDEHMLCWSHQFFPYSFLLNIHRWIRRYISLSLSVSTTHNNALRQVDHCRMPARMNFFNKHISLMCMDVALLFTCWKKSQKSSASLIFRSFFSVPFLSALFIWNIKLNSSCMQFSSFLLSSLFPQFSFYAVFCVLLLYRRSLLILCCLEIFKS